MSRRAAFTLVELVVVIMILGILAAVAVPKLITTTGSATDNGLRQTLSVVRDAIEMYAAENNGALPPCTGDGTDFKNAVAKYLRGSFPTCPVGANRNSQVGPSTDAADPMTPAGGTGWLFNTNDGRFIANTGQTGYDGVAYNTY